MATLSFLTYLRGIYNLNMNSSSKVHNALIQSIYDCFIMAKNDVDLARLEMCLSTATGHWLDHWGEFFSVYRKSGEQDDHFSSRIIDSVIQPKSTIPSIKNNIVDYLNSEYHTSYTTEDVLIREPWTEVAKYSHRGTLSSGARFYSPDYYCHAVLSINIPEKVTNELVDLVKSVKAAGVSVIWSTLNSYDIVSEFNTAADAWASYTRHIQTRTERNQSTGLVLSNSSPRPQLSGSQNTWYTMSFLYDWYETIKKNTDDSVIITKKDLVGLLDYFTKDSSNSDELIKISEEILENLKLLDMITSEELTFNGKVTTVNGTNFEYNSPEELFDDLVISINRFKEENPEYYDNVQPFILNGERAMWLVTRNANNFGDTPTLTFEDFYKLWEPFGEYNSLEEFEDAYEKGFITLTDKYQPPIVIGKPFYWTPILSKNWMFDSPVFTNEDLEALYLRQFYPQGTVLKENPLLEEIMILEEEYLGGYSYVGEEQPPIEITHTLIDKTTSNEET